jgi:hypothetical protein
MIRTLLTASLSAALLLLPASAHARPTDPNGVPRGQTYWLSDYTPAADLTVVRLDGRKIRVGNALAPCFTGIRNKAGTYAGGGYTQGGPYNRARLRITQKSGVLRMRYSTFPNDPPLVYYRATRSDAIKAMKHYGYGKRSQPWRLFTDCKLP